MKIIINVSSIFKGGAEQVAVSFINECKKFEMHSYDVVLCDNISSQLDINEFPNNFNFHILPSRPGANFKSYLRTIRFLNNLEKKINPDVVIATGGHGYWKPKTPIVGGFNIPHYIYPESPYFTGMKFRKRLYWYFMRKIHLFFYKRLNAIIVQTDDVNERLKKVIGDKKSVYTVSNTVNGYFINSKEYPNKLRKKQKDEVYLLTLSSYYPHKNIEIIKKVIEVLKNIGRDEFVFVLTLPEDKYTKAFGDFETNQIINIGPIPIAECPSLYRECDFMFLPTLLECYSASYAEAMIMQKPILTSDLSFAHTVCKDAAEYFNPLDAQDISQTIMNLSSNKARQKEMISRGLEIIRNTNTAAERAAEFLRICEATVRKNK